MNIKKNILLFAVCTFTFFSCTSEDDMVENTKISNNEIYAPQVFAKQLALSLKNNDNLRDFLKEEANKQKDGDYDILIAEIIDQEVKTESMLRSANASDVAQTFRECINQNGDITSVLTDIEKNFPLLQVSIPNMENASWESVASGKAPFYVAFLPFNYKEGDDVLSYDQNGNEHILDGKKAPKTPVIVIGINERIMIAASADYHRNNEMKTDAPTLRSATNPTLWKAAFASQNAMQQYEPWTKGRPEVEVVISNGVTYTHTEFDDQGWWDANEKLLNYHPGFSFAVQSTNGYQTNYFAMRYAWWELDFSFSLGSKPYSIPVYNSDGFQFNILAYLGWIGDSNDYIGHADVNRYTNSSGKKYTTIDGKHGSGDLYFWLN